MGGFSKVTETKTLTLFIGVSRESILAVLWNSKTGCATATDIALATGLANNTLTTMIKS